MKLDRRAGCARVEQLWLPAGSACASPEAGSNGGLQVMWQGLGAWPVQCLTGTCRPSRCTNVCVFWACISTCTGVRPPQARLINHAVSVRSALSGAQPASQLSGKVTVAKPNWAKLTIAGSSENMETCLTPTRYCRNPLRMHVHCGSMYAVKEATVLSQHVSVYLFLASPPTSSEHLPTEGHIWSGYICP